MIRSSAPPDRAGPGPNPYPEQTGTITDVTYDTGLVLLRLKDAVKLRDGEDADYIVGADYSISYRLDGGPQRTITVPRGLITDLASVPQFARTLVSRVGPHLEAAIVHDYLYIAWQDFDGGVPRPQDRNFADALFLEAMVAANVGWVGRNSIHRAVRAFGWWAFASREDSRYVDLDDPDVVAQFPRPIGGVLA